jgi:hypothetical protein
MLNRFLHCKTLFPFLLACMIVSLMVEVLVVPVQAAELSQEPTQEEVEQAIDNFACALEGVHKTTPTISEEVVAQQVLAYAMSDQQMLSSRTKRSISSFQQCFADKMGLTGLRDIAKRIFSPQIIKLLKKGAWQKASAGMVSVITKFASKKLAKLAVKKLASLALPGIGWGSVAIWGAQCGWNEIH